MNRYERRIATIREQMQADGIDAMFLPPSGDLEYVTGLRRQRPNATENHMFGDYLYGVLITRDRTVVFAPHLAKLFVEEQVSQRPWLGDVVHLPEADDDPDVAWDTFRKLGLAEGTVAIAKHGLAMTIVNLQRRFPNMRFTNSEDIISPMRAVKDPEDLEAMRRAARLTDDVYRAVLKQIKPGMTEAELTAEIDWQMLKHGAEGNSFATAVFCRGPHNQRGLENTVNRITGGTLELGSALAFDFGLVLDGWVSDFGRTVYIGEPNALMLETHRLVAEAQRQAMRVMVGGTKTGREVDAAARDYLAEHGYRKEFFHRLGHGIGIDVHERPFLSQLDDTVIQNGMTFTVEPSLWLDGHHFVRVEDVVVVTETGGQSLNDVSTDEIIVIE